MGAAICAWEGAERVGRVAHLRREGPGCGPVHRCSCDNRGWQDFTLHSQPGLVEGSCDLSGLGRPTAEPRAAFTGVVREPPDARQWLRRAGASESEALRTPSYR